VNIFATAVLPFARVVFRSSRASRCEADDNTSSAADAGFERSRPADVIHTSRGASASPLAPRAAFAFERI
jgi:hypothetical protein